MSITKLLHQLKACGVTKNLREGVRLHKAATCSGQETNRFVATAVMDMYAKCGSLADAQQLLDRCLAHDQRDITGDAAFWNALLLGYVRSGQSERALEQFTRMKQCQVPPNPRSYVAALLAAADLGEEKGGLDYGIRLHCAAKKLGFNKDMFVANTLIHFYSKCHSILHARSVFDAMTNRTSVSWNAMMNGYILDGKPEKVLELFVKMRHAHMKGDSRTFVLAITACGSLGEKWHKEDRPELGAFFLRKGRSLHEQAMEEGVDQDVFVTNTLVTMYHKCGSVWEAHDTFHRIAENQRGLASWNALLSAYANSGLEALALETFAKMKVDGSVKPDGRTIVAALVACTNLASKRQSDIPEYLEIGKKIHKWTDQMPAIAVDVFVRNSLIQMYSKCHSMDDAKKVFNGIDCPNAVSWTSLMQGYTENEQPEVALHLFNTIVCPKDARSLVTAIGACACMADRENGKEVRGKLRKVQSLIKGKWLHDQARDSGWDVSDPYVAVSLINMYARCGSMDSAQLVFDRLPVKKVKCWNALAQGYAENSDYSKALEMIERNPCDSNARSYMVAMISAGNVLAIGVGRAIHARICRYGLMEEDVIIQTTSIKFYGKCGRMDIARHLFDSWNSAPDVVVWDALLAGYVLQGDATNSFRLFHRMLEENISPDEATYLSMLTVCAHLGLVDDAYQLLMRMNVAPNVHHYTCMVDVLGRANRMKEAIQLINSMPCEADSVTWMALLGASRKWKDVSTGKLAFENVMRLDKKRAAAYVLMANIYANATKWKERDDIVERRNKIEAWKKPGQSWYCSDDEAGKLHSFKVGDKSHPQMWKIQAKLDSLLRRMKEHGYVADANICEAGTEDEENALCGHSERLAIGCALVNSAPGTTIRIVKNMRVCEDCHNATALISKLERRVILLKDANRLHIFAKGECSCRNFW